MFKNKLGKVHFPTALGLLILLVAIGVGLYFIKNRSGVTSKAEETAAPKQVRITNISDTSLSVSWLTDSAATGSVKYGSQMNELKQEALDDRDQLSGEEAKFNTHHVTLKNLQASTKYYFKIVSAAKEYDNQGKSFEVTTGIGLGVLPTADPVYGTILTQSGTAAEGAIVYINLAGGGALSALAKTNGNWAISLATARTSDLASYLKYDTQATIVNLLIQGGDLGTASAITTTANDSPVPEITLGKSHDFRAQATTSVSTLDSSSADEGESGFSLTSLDGNTATFSGEVTLENPSFEGEVINATQPAFIGEGPAGTVLAIEINSEDSYTGSVTIDDEGSWEFTPPEGLAPGEHLITISYLDSEGDEQSFTRSFVIAQAGDSEIPAITATPSGEVVADAARTKMPSTESGIPSPGSGEVSLLMLLSGLGLLIGGLKLKNIV